MLENEFIRKIGIRFPIIQAPMAGGPTTPELVASVSNSGGLGTLGAGYLTPEQIRSAIREVRERTDRPFGVNLFVPEQPTEAEDEIVIMNGHLNQYRAYLGIPLNPAIPRFSESYEDQVQVLLEEKVPVFSFTFGIPPADVIQAMKRNGTVVIGAATTVEEGIRLEFAGVDAIVAQGSEAGGHRGTFLGKAADSLIGTMALVPQLADDIGVPVIASGGIMDGRGLVASLALGASAVQMGTAFLASPESGAHDIYKRKLFESREDSTDVTEAYSGKAARGIRTEYMASMKQFLGTIPAYPIQNVLTRDIRQAAARANNPEYLSLWAGQGLRLVQDRAAGEIVKQTMEQACAIVRGFGGSGER